MGNVIFIPVGGRAVHRYVATFCELTSGTKVDGEQRSVSPDIGLTIVGGKTVTVSLFVALPQLFVIVYVIV